MISRKPFTWFAQLLVLLLIVCPLGSMVGCAADSVSKFQESVQHAKDKVDSKVSKDVAALLPYGEPARNLLSGILGGVLLAAPFFVKHKRAIAAVAEIVPDIKDHFDQAPYSPQTQAVIDMALPKQPEPLPSAGAEETHTSAPLLGHHAVHDASH